jgi:hypothetical protein
VKARIFIHYFNLSKNMNTLFLKKHIKNLLFFNIGNVFVFIDFFVVVNFHFCLNNFFICFFRNNVFMYIFKL